MINSGCALITGAAKRVGREIALHLASLGYDIAIHYNNSSKDASELKKLIQDRYSVKCEIFKFNLFDYQNVFTLIDRVKENFENLNVLINSASVFERAYTSGTDTDLFDSQMNINFKSPYFLTKRFAEICKHGNIINIIDTKISKTQHQYSAYILSKKMLGEFTLLAAKEYAPNIRVNGICPGLVLPDESGNQKINNLIRQIPMGNTGSPANIVSGIEFILSNSFITGHNLFIDGGEHLL